MTLTNLETNALRVIIELANRGEPPTTEEVAEELDVPIATVTEIIDDLWRAGHVSEEGSGWSADTRIELPSDEVFVGFFEDLKLVEEFHQVE